MTWNCETDVVVLCFFLRNSNDCRINDLITKLNYCLPDAKPCFKLLPSMLLLVLGAGLWGTQCVNTTMMYFLRQFCYRAGGCIQLGHAHTNSAYMSQSASVDCVHRLFQWPSAVCCVGHGAKWTARGMKSYLNCSTFVSLVSSLR